MFVANNSLPGAEEVYASACLEHPELTTFDPTQVKGLASRVLARISVFEQVAREPIEISPKTAADIETVWVHSGTGNYDNPFKSDDNERLKDLPWMGGQDRARLDRGVCLAQRIAEIRSGQPTERITSDSPLRQVQATRQLITTHGPTLFYSGYESETKYVSRLVDRPDFVMPAEKIRVLDTSLQTTTDAVKTFEYTDEKSATKNVVVVSHAPHVGGRILHMMQHFQPLHSGSVPYVSPIASPEIGRYDFAMMEVRGLLYYAFLRGQASEMPHRFQLLQ
jgi:hypothetical protein